MKTLYVFLTLAFANSILAQQVPNGGFENWSSPNGYNIPQSWSTLNDATSEIDIFTCTQGNPGNPGSFYMKLTSRNVVGFGVIPGRAVCGTINVTTFQPEAGFPYTSRPTALTGVWQYMSMAGSDIGYISVSLTKWDNMNNERIDIGQGLVNLTGMEMSCDDFSIPINYSSDLTPDSCMIVLSASGGIPANNSFLYVDDLAFELPVGIHEKLGENIFNSYPNPFQDRIIIDLPQGSMIEEMIIYNQQGKVVYQCANTSINTHDLEELAIGMYLIQIKSEGIISRQKIMKKG